MVGAADRPCGGRFRGLGRLQGHHPTYRATATIFVNQSAAPGTVTYSDALLSQQLVKTYARMAIQRVVLEQVAEELELAITPADLDDLLDGVAIAQTQLLEVRAETPDSALSRDLANSVARVFIEQQQPFLPPERGAQALRIAQPAALPTKPVAPRVVLNTILGVLAGLLAAAGHRRVARTPRRHRQVA